MGRRQKGTAPPADVRPVDVDGVRTVAIVTVGWGVAFVVLALRQGALNDAGRGWWLWTCLAGVGLGLLGLEYCRKRRDAIAQAALDAEAESDDADDPSLVGDWSRMPDEASDAFGHEQPQADEQAAAPAGTYLTQPYAPADSQTGYSTGDVPPLAPRHRAPVSQHSAEWPQPGHQPRPQAPPAAQPPVSMPPASGHRSQQPASPQPPAAQQPAPARHQPTTGQQPSGKPEPPPGRSHSPTAPAPAQQPEAPPEDPYSTGAGWYDSPAGYSPDPDRTRRHPRDRAAQAQRPTPPEPEPKAADRDRPRRSSLEDSEFFGAESSPPPANSTAEFLLSDLADDDDQPQEPPPSRHDRDAPEEDYRGRRARRPR